MFGALLGGALSLFGKSRDAKRQRRADELDYQRNRPINQVAEWEKAGINPVMGITQGQWVPASSNPVMMGDAWANAGAMIGEALDLKHGQKLRETELKKENKKLKNAIAKDARPKEPTNMARMGVEIPDQEGGLLHPRFGPYSGRPQSRPEAGDEARTRVFLPDGQPRYIPAAVAERLSIPSNTTMTAGEYADIVGEARGEVEAVLVADKIGENMGVPVFGDDPDPFKAPDIRPSPKVQLKGSPISQMFQ